MKLCVLSFCFFLTTNIVSAQYEHANLVELVGTYIGAGEYEKAIPIAEKALSVAKTQYGISHPAYATSLSDLGVINMNLGKFERAESLYHEAIKIRKKTLGENHSDYGASLNNLANLYKKQGFYKKAEPLFVASIHIKRKMLKEYHESFIRSVNNLADLYFKIGQNQKADSLLTEVVRITQTNLEITDPEYAPNLTSAAMLYLSGAQFGKAEQLLLLISKDLKSATGEESIPFAQNLHNLAVLFDEMGHYNKAEEYQLQAINIFSKKLGENDPTYAAAIGMLANLYLSLKLYDKALPLSEKAVAIIANTYGTMHPEYARLAYNLAHIYSNLELFDKAEQWASAALEIRKSVAGIAHPDYARSLNSLAGIYALQEKYEKAEPVALAAAEIRKKASGEKSTEYGSSLQLLGELYRVLGKNEQAEKYLFESEKIFSGTLGITHPSYAISLMNRAKLYQKLGRYPEANPLIVQAYSIIRKNAINDFYNLSEDEKQKYLEEKLNITHLANSSLYYFRNTPQTIIRELGNIQLFFKGIVLDNSQKTLEALKHSDNAALKKGYIQWLELKKYLSKQYSLPIEYRGDDLKSKVAEAESLEKELQRKSFDFRMQSDAINISMKEVQKALKKGEAAIEFVSFNLFNGNWTDSVIYAAYLLRSDDSLPVFIPLFEERELIRIMDSAGQTSTAVVDNLYRGLKVKKRGMHLEDSLFKIVWQPLEPYLKNIERIAYSPAGKLYGIAFHALSVDSSTILMDKYQLQQYTSIRQAAMKGKEEPIVKPSGIVLFGNPDFSIDSLQLTQKKSKKSTASAVNVPRQRNGNTSSWTNLPGTEEEVKKIRHLFESNKVKTELFVRSSASEENFKSVDSLSLPILHIATHGFFLPDQNKKVKEVGLSNVYAMADDPLIRSGLIFAGADHAWSGKIPVEGVEDGIATSYEISQLNLSNTELVVLSACETGLGDVRGSEGVFGLQRAFKMAGVKKMIVSLWQVPDKETAELMIAFYSYWMNGKKINEAFSLAQTDMRKKYSPFYWAAFVLIE